MQVACKVGVGESYPAALNEAFPDAVRSLFPGLFHQLGVLLVRHEHMN